MTVSKRHYNSGCLLLPVEGSLPVATQREQPLVILLGQHLACQLRITQRITQRMHGVVQCTVHCTQCTPYSCPKASSPGHRVPIHRGEWLGSSGRTDAAHEGLELCRAVDPAVVRPVNGHGREGGLHGWA